MSVDQVIPSGWCWRRWLACLDWQADSIPDPHCKSRKLLYPMQQLMGLSKGGFFFICSISLYQVQSKPAVILFLLGAFKGKFFKFKGLSFKSKGLSSKYHKWMKTKHLQDRSWTNRGNLRIKKWTWFFPWQSQEILPLDISSVFWLTRVVHIAHIRLFLAPQAFSGSIWCNNYGNAKKFPKS